MRQDHAAPRDRRTRHPDDGPHRAGRPRRLRSSPDQARLRHRLSVVRAVPEPDRGPERRVRPREHPHPARSDRQARPRAARADGPGRARQQVPGPALGRPAAAGGARARAGDLAGPALARRAALGARREGAVRLGKAELACDVDGLPSGTAVTLAIRPEDIVVHDDARGDANALTLRVDALAFLGSFFRADLAGGETNVLLRADLPADMVRRRRIAEKSALSVLLPPERIRIYPGSAVNR